MIDQNGVAKIFEERNMDGHLLLFGTDELLEISVLVFGPFGFLSYQPHDKLGADSGVGRIAVAAHTSVDHDSLIDFVGGR